MSDGKIEIMKRYILIALLLVGCSQPHEPVIVFLGDSTITRWEWEGYETWTREYPDAINAGVGGDTPMDVIHRLDTIHITPDIVVLSVGINGIGTSTVRDIRWLVFAIQDKWPDCKVLMVSTLGGIWDTGLAGMDNGDTVRVLCIDPERGSDGIHLTSDGYKEWSREMQPVLREMMR